jgi:hypothetical protein
VSLIVTSSVSLSSANTYYGPNLNISPDSITSGSSVNIQLSTGSGSTFTAPPSGSNLCNPLDPSTCSFPLQSCTLLNYYQINQVTVTDPNGNSYMLGSSATSGLSNPSIGRFTNSAGGPFAPAINVSATDSGSISLGSGVGGFYALNSNLPNPPNNVNPEEPYYWWTVSGNVYGSNLRHDQNPSIQPTATVGTYTADIEGLVFCGSTTLFFDAAMQFVVTTSTTSTTSTTTTTTTTTTSTTTTSTTATSTTTTTSAGGATRTIGWWQTHLAIEQSTWASYIAANPSGASICGLTVTTASQAMGGFWASIPKTSTGAHRDNVPHAEMILVQQWIGALLNTQAFGTSDGGLLASGVTACNTDNVNTITSAANALDNFNSGGDNIASPIPTGSATPQAAQLFANVVFWDSI